MVGGVFQRRLCFKRAIEIWFSSMETIDSRSMEEERQELRVMMVPWLSKSHIRAFLHLANNLGAHGLQISFLSTPLNTRWIRQQISERQISIPQIDLLELSLPTLEGLPDGVESTADLKRGGTFELLIKAMDEWEKPFEALLTRLSPDFVVHDMTQYWASSVAAKLGIPTLLFGITSAASTAFLLGHQTMIAEKRVTLPDLTAPPPDFPSSLIRHSPFNARKNIQVFHTKEGHVNMAERWRLCFKGSWVVVLNTCGELESKYLEYLERTTGRPALPVGIQMPDLTPQPAVDERSLAWLDAQKPRSVVVVSFGSECILGPQELAALALGLEDTHLPFLLILLHQMAAALPQGFVERTQGRGLLVTEWAPQTHILAHPSAGAFLTQCGWLSVCEALMFGVPFVTLPFQYEQELNAKLIAEELKFGVQVRRSDEDDSFCKEDVSKAVRTVMVEEDGRYMRSKVEEISGLLSKNGHHVHRSNIHNVISLMREKSSYK